MYATDPDTVKSWQAWDDERKAESTGDARPWEQWDAERLVENAAGPAPAVLTSLQGRIDAAVAGVTVQQDNDARANDGKANSGKEKPPAVSRTSQPSSVGAAESSDE